MAGKFKNTHFFLLFFSSFFGFLSFPIRITSFTSWMSSTFFVGFRLFFVRRTFFGTFFAAIIFGFTLFRFRNLIFLSRFRRCCGIFVIISVSSCWRKNSWNRCIPGWTFSDGILDQVGTFQIPGHNLDKSRTLKISSGWASSRWTFGIHPAQWTGLPLKFFHQIVYVSRTDSQNSQLISRRRFFVSNLIGITGQILIWSCSGNSDDGLV